MITRWKMALWLTAGIAAIAATLGLTGKAANDRILRQFWQLVYQDKVKAGHVQADIKRHDAQQREKDQVYIDGIREKIREDRDENKDDHRRHGTGSADGMQ